MRAWRSLQYRVPMRARANNDNNSDNHHHDCNDYNSIHDHRTPNDRNGVHLNHDHYYNRHDTDDHYAATVRKWRARRRRAV